MGERVRRPTLRYKIKVESGKIIIVCNVGKSLDKRKLANKRRCNGWPNSLNHNSLISCRSKGGH